LFAVAGPASPRLRGAFTARVANKPYWTSMGTPPKPVQVVVDYKGIEHVVGRMVDGVMRTTKPGGLAHQSPAKQEEAPPAIVDGPDGSGDEDCAAGWTYCQSLDKCLQDSDQKTPCPSVGATAPSANKDPTEDPAPPKPTATVPDKLGSYWGYLGTTRVKWMVDSLGIPHVIARMVNGKQMGVKPGGGGRGGRAPRTPLSSP